MTNYLSHMLLARINSSKWIATCVAVLCQFRPRFCSCLPLRYLSGPGTGAGLMKTSAGTGTGHGTTIGAMFAGWSAGGCTPSWVRPSAAEARCASMWYYVVRHCVNITSITIGGWGMSPAWKSHCCHHSAATYSLL